MIPRILIIEDDTDVLRGLFIRLKHEGYVVYFCLTGIEALTAAEDLRPDLILLDLGLPGKNGFQIMHELKANLKKQVPVIVLTASDPNLTRWQALEAGATHFFQKPFEDADLIACIKSTLGIGNVESAA